VSEEEVNKDLFRLAREMIGPVASFNKAVAVQAIPRTRSGKIPRNSIAQLATSKLTKVESKYIFWLRRLVTKCVFQVPSTVEDPNVYFELTTTLQRIGLANNSKLR
jgi:propionyl-CoA synthetase